MVRTRQNKQTHRLKQRNREMVIEDGQNEHERIDRVISNLGIFGVTVCECEKKDEGLMRGECARRPNTQFLLLCFLGGDWNGLWSGRSYENARAHTHTRHPRTMTPRTLTTV